MVLDEAIRRALERSPALAQTEASLSSAEQGKRTAIGAYIPRVSLGSGASKNSSTRYDERTQTTIQGSSESYSASLSGSLSLYDGGGRGYALAQARADLLGAEATLEDQRNNVVYQTKNLFFAALRQSDLLAVNERRVEQAEESMDMTRRRTQVGTGTASDTLRARLELANALLFELGLNIHPVGIVVGYGWFGALWILSLFQARRRPNRRQSHQPPRRRGHESVQGVRAVHRIPVYRNLPLSPFIQGLNRSTLISSLP